MQLKPLVPAVSVRILPSASIATTVAPLAIAAGAPDIALLIICSSVGDDCAAGTRLVVRAHSAATATRPINMADLRMDYLRLFGRSHKNALLARGKRRSKTMIEVSRKKIRLEPLAILCNSAIAWQAGE
jgi:hypothetical protein